MRAAHAFLRLLGALVERELHTAAASPVRVLSLLARATIGGAALIFAAAASAQTPPPAAPAQIEEIVVTGSRIASPNAASASPIQGVSSQEVPRTRRDD